MWKHFLPLLVFIVALEFLVFLPQLTSVAAASDGDALLAFQSCADRDHRLDFLRNNSRNARSYCQWQGVRCSTAGKVTRLVLENLGLRGMFSELTLTRLDQLRILSLKNNSIIGPIPDLSPLSNLKALFLSHNRFVGSFPSSLLFLHRLRTLDVSYNNLSGAIPPAVVSSLDHLYCLHLEHNRLNGSIPAFNQSSLKIFNVSCNQLSGPVPVTAILLSFQPAVFSGNPELCGEAVRKECRYGYFFRPSPVAPTSPAEAMEERGGQLQGSLLPDTSAPVSPRRRHKKASVTVGIFCGIALAIGLFSILLMKRKQQQQQHRKHGRILVPQKSTAASAADAPEICWEDRECNINGEDGSNNNGNGSFCSSELAAAAAMTEEKVKKLGKSGSLVFCAGEASVYTLEQLMKASAEMLGRGSVGTTYKAVLDNRLIMSVKRLDAGKMGMSGKEAFEGHMETVGRLRHPNLVPLRAFFQAKEERLLVYDYQPNGSLYSLIHGSRSTRAKPLHWTSCLKIAEDVAQGLAYIHQASRLVHGNLKASNVLLGADFEACITDNCLAILVEPSDGVEDLGHRAPEARNSNRHLTPKSDIYSFGILLLELLTGKPPLQHPFVVATDLPVWVRSVREDNGGEDERLMMLVDIAASCVRSSPESRPTTWQVLKMIQEVKEADMEESEYDSPSMA